MEQDSQFYTRCIDTVYNGSIQSLLAIGHEWLKLPIIMENASHNLLGILPEQKQTDALFESARENGGAKIETLLRLEEEGILPAIISSNRPVFLDWGIFKDSPRIAVCIKSSKNELLGTCVCLCNKESYRDEYRDIIALLARCASIILEKDISSVVKNSFSQLKFLTKLFSGEFRTQQMLDIYATALKQKLRPPYTFMAIGSSDGQYSALSQKKLYKFFHEYFPSLLWSPLPDETVIMHNAECALTFDDVIEIIEHKLGVQNLRYGISLPCFDIENLFAFKQQSLDILQISSQLSLKQRINKYEDNILPVLTTSFLKNNRNRAFYHPCISYLKEYDIKNKTEYLPTLSSYIHNNRSSSTTARALHLHRNTLLYRLNRIKELCNLNLDDPTIYTWLLCCFIAESIFRIE